ncbi:hypothetical protein J2X48_002934 [Bosea sp. BE271]|uniref:COG3904 family protein n=1 Tax=Bosea TaxID=85413 RepID=UPI00286486A3|nr:MULTISPECIES: hypothetical protein [Bosea]MDR6829019.1 hypothetical protein [Bosea robiniae]MDR6895903.1 hypothetical protein [Bosea sp. BE109]MDR7139300.1 hypothetical protein [Bosea sp. BE168]MDR7175998.1 hypothetical protein [Bosea sp. BE271]
MRAVLTWVVGLLAISLGFTNLSGAADISAIPGTNGGPAIILVRGELAIGDDKAFANVALVHSSAVVVLDSNGGLLLPGLEIGKAIRLKGFATVVPEGFQCASACALAWLAGTPRLLSPSGRVGFHAAYLESDGKLMPAATGNALVGAYLNQLNLPTSAVIYITSAPPEGMRWLNLADAQQNGIEARRFDPRSSSKGPDLVSRSPSNPSLQPPVPPPSAPSVPSASTAAPEARPVRSPPGTFGEYPSAVLPGPRTTPVLDTPEKRAYRTRLRAAANGRPNFGGKFAVAEWGCGTSCITGAIVDLQTGDVVFLPGTFSGWGLVDPNFKAAEYRLNSSLIVLSGQVNEEGPIGSHYFHLLDGQFRYLGTVLTSNDFKAQLGARWLPEVASRVAPKSAPAMAASVGETLKGRIAEFACGDNCYLSIVNDFGKKHDGLCVAPACEAWNKAAAIPAGLKGRQVEIRVGMGSQTDVGGTGQGRMLSFREITIFPAGGSSQP